MQASLAECFIQMRRHGLQLALNLAGRDNQPIRVIGAASHVQNHDVFGLVVFQALARCFYKYLQPVRCKFFAASATGGAGRSDLRGGFRLGLGLRLSRGLAGLGGRLWRWLSCGGFGGSAFRRWRGSFGFRRSFAGLGGRLRCSGFGRSGFGRGLRLGRGGSFRLGACFCLGRGFGLWLGGGAALWAFFGRGGLAGYGRLLSF